MTIREKYDKPNPVQTPTPPPPTPRESVHDTVWPRTADRFKNADKPVRDASTRRQCVCATASMRGIADSPSIRHHLVQHRTTSDDCALRTGGSEIRARRGLKQGDRVTKTDSADGTTGSRWADPASGRTWEGATSMKGSVTRPSSMVATDDLCQPAEQRLGLPAHPHTWVRAIVCQENRPGRRAGDDRGGKATPTKRPGPPSRDDG